MCWHLITGQSLWKDVIVAKYISPRNPLDWIRYRIGQTSGASIIWKAINKAAHIIQLGLSWQIGSGAMVRIGTDSWSSSGDHYKLPVFITEHLAHRNIFYLAQIADLAHSSWQGQAWLSAADLDIPQAGARIWQRYIWALKATNIRITE